MRKSLVTFASVESQWSDKGRSQIARGKDRVGGPEPDCSFKTVKVERMVAWGVAELRKDFFFFLFMKSACSSAFVSKGKASGRSEVIGMRDGRKPADGEENNQEGEKWGNTGHTHGEVSTGKGRNSSFSKTGCGSVLSDTKRRKGGSLDWVVALT